jgi:molecular chaperone GrpE
VNEESMVNEATNNNNQTATEAEEASLSLAEQLTAAEAKAAEYLDGWQRARAEFANARKRLERERSEAYVNASVDIVTQLIPILDDYDRALNSVPAAIAQDKWYEGIQLVRRKLQTILDNLRVTPIQAVGQPFDPNLHEALSLQPSDQYESGTVIAEAQAGYKLGDRVLRPALVFVAE